MPDPGTDAAPVPPATPDTPELVRVLDRLASVPRPHLLLLGLVTTLLIGLADLLTGTTLSLRFLYLIPLFLVTWVLGALAGSVIALVAVGTGIVSVGLASRDLDALVLVNAGLRLLVFLVAMVLFDQLHQIVRLEHERARRDPLTGALARWAFVEEVERVREAAVVDGSPVTIMHVDLNRFLMLLPTSGVSSDEMTRKFLAAIGASLPADAVVGRLGGDEFAALVPRCDVARARTLAGQVNDSVLSVPETTVRFGPRVGLAVYRRMPATAEDMVTMADELVYDVRPGERGLA